MKNLFIATSAVTTLLISIKAEAAQIKEVEFESNNQTLVGNLYLPDDYQAGTKLPATVITGAWTTVKEQMPANYAEAMADRYFSDKAIGLLDYHTGLGQYATGQLMCLTEESQVQLARSIWGDKVVTTGSENSVAAYIPTGTLMAAVQAKLANSTCIAAVYEFGTIPEHEVFNALRADHWLYLHGDLDTEEALSIKQNMLDAFYCDRPDWQKSVCELAFAAQDELLTGLRSL